MDNGESCFTVVSLTMSSPYFHVVSRIVFLFSYAFFSRCRLFLCTNWYTFFFPFLDVVFSFVLIGISRGTESVNCLLLWVRLLILRHFKKIVLCFGLRVSRLNRPHLPPKRLWGGWGEIYGVLFYQSWVSEMMGHDKMSRTKMWEEAFLM